MLTIEEAIEELKVGGEIEMHCGHHSFIIGQSFSFIGGDGMTGFISEVLGNVVYQSAEHIIRESYNYLVKNSDREVIITF